MSLYANINVSKAQEEAATVKIPPAKISKSAALYAGVLAKPPPPKESVPAPVLEDIRPPVELEAEKPTEASGTLEKYYKLITQHFNSNLQSVGFRKLTNRGIQPSHRIQKL